MAVSELEKKAENMIKIKRIPNRTDNGMSSKNMPPVMTSGYFDGLPYTCVK